jgi:hypothetical protein
MGGMRKVDIYKYTRFFIFAVFTVLSVLAVTSQQAQAMDPVAREVDPRCDPDIDEIQQNHAFLKQIEHQARTSQNSPQNDTVHALACTDQQLIQSAKAGAIFSDTAPASFPTDPFDAVISIGLDMFSGALPGWAGALLETAAGPDQGYRGATLLEDFTSVIGDVLSELLGQFTNAITGFISDALGATIGGILGGIIGSFAGDLVANWFGGGGGIGAESFNCTHSLDVWSDPSSTLPAGSHPVIGTGPKIGIDSGDYHLAWPSESDIVNGIFAGLPTQYVTKFSEPDNATTLNNVLTDLTTRLVPGGIGAYKCAPGQCGLPALNLNSNLTAVIGAM